MDLIEFSIEEKEYYTIVSFDLKDAISPDIISSIIPPKVNATKGVLLNGRGPIWLYCFLAHYYHPTAFIATYDPRLGGAVIVESHKQGFKIGDMIREGQDE